jgi:hypothetical protein
MYGLSVQRNIAVQGHKNVRDPLTKQREPHHIHSPLEPNGEPAPPFRAVRLPTHTHYENLSHRKKETCCPDHTGVSTLV